MIDVSTAVWVPGSEGNPEYMVLRRNSAGHFLGVKLTPIHLSPWKCLLDVRLRVGMADIGSTEGKGLSTWRAHIKHELQFEQVLDRCTAREVQVPGGSRGMGIGMGSSHASLKIPLTMNYGPDDLIEMPEGAYFADTLMPKMPVAVLLRFALNAMDVVVSPDLSVDLDGVVMLILGSMRRVLERQEEIHGALYNRIKLLPTDTAQQATDGDGIQQIPEGMDPEIAKMMGLDGTKGADFDSTVVK